MDTTTGWQTERPAVSKSGYVPRHIFYHEASHAVIARGFKIKVSWVLPTGIKVEKWAAGQEGTTPSLIDAARRNALVLLAGALGEVRIRPADDALQSVLWVTHWASDALNAHKFVNRMVRLADGVACDAKLTHTQDAESYRLFNHLLGEVDALVEEHWSAIERVAAGLFLHKRLDRDMLDALIVNDGSVSVSQLPLQPDEVVERAWAETERTMLAELGPRLHGDWWRQPWALEWDNQLQTEIDAQCKTLETEFEAEPKRWTGA